MLGGGVSGFIFKMMANSSADMYKLLALRLKDKEQVEESISSARKFTNAFVNFTRRFIVIAVFAMLGFVVVAGVFVPTNILIEVLPTSILGFIKFGGGVDVITVEGLVAYPWLPAMATTIIGFYFGQGSAKRT
jgi:hypothetical protein